METISVQELLTKAGLHNDPDPTITPHFFIDLMSPLGYKGDVRETRCNLLSTLFYGEVANKNIMLGGERSRQALIWLAQNFKEEVMLSEIIDSVNVSPVSMLNKGMVEAVYLSEIDYSKPIPYFLLTFRFKDGGTTAAYIDKGNVGDLQKIHAILAGHLSIGKWTVVDQNGKIPAIALN